MRIFGKEMTDKQVQLYMDGCSNEEYVAIENLKQVQLELEAKAICEAETNPVLKAEMEALMEKGEYHLKYLYNK